MTDATAINRPSLDELLEMYGKMVLTRIMEEGLFREHRAGNIRGPIHTCDGQEAVGVGVTAVLNREDTITSTHRGHAHFIGKGVETGALMAEIYGRETGTCRGRAGHMLVADASHGLLGASAIVGGGPPLTVGQALAFQCQGQGRVAVTFFGDGASHNGMVHEAMNIAGLWKLPAIFVCENNQYGLTVAARRQTAIEDIVVRAAGYGMPGVKVDGNDAVAVYRAAAAAVARARAGEGPTLIEAKTYRLKGFSTTDLGGYQPEEEVSAWRARDPIARLRARLAEEVGAGELDRIEGAAAQTLAAAFAFATESPVTPLDDLFVDEYVTADASHG